MDSQKESVKDQLMNAPPGVGVIVPVLNEAENISACLQHLLKLKPEVSEIIVVDGGSSDVTLELLSKYTGDDRVTLVKAAAGRGQQMNAGAACSRSDVFLFMHADTKLPVAAVDAIRHSIRHGAEWGRFDIRLDDRRFVFRIIETMMNIRSCATGICTGDQAMFVRGDVFNIIGGFSDIPLMEDIEICQRIIDFGNPDCLHQPVVTSARRWQQRGILRTVIFMWWLRLLYWLGRSPEKLARVYRQVR